MLRAVKNAVEIRPATANNSHFQNRARPIRVGLKLLTLSCLTFSGLAVNAGAVQAQTSDPAYLAGIKQHHLLVSTVPANGDQNPYALAIAPVTAGTLAERRRAGR